MDPSLREPLRELLLSVADDKFLLGHRNADWTGLGPILEEDIAFSSIAQDEIGHAEALYQLIHAELGGATANELAYARAPAEYRCAALIEQPDEFDWARAIVRQFFCDHFDVLRLQRLAMSSWKPLAALASRMLAEERVHVQHADTWIQRLGRGTSDSHQRMQNGINLLWKDVAALFEHTGGEDALERAGLYRPLQRPTAALWHEAVRQQAAAGGLTIPADIPDLKSPDGRHGVHTPEFAELLAELTEVYRVEPGAAW